MVQINLSSKYFLYNRGLGGDVVLASTPFNDSLVILPMGYDDNKMWYFTWITDDNARQGYFYFHTMEKGDLNVLGAYSDDGDASNRVVDFHFVRNDGATGQFWMLQDQEDGTVTLGNKFAGNSLSLDVVKDTTPPQLTFSSRAGLKWTVSEATATPSALSNSTLFSLTTSTPFPSTTFTTSTLSTGSGIASNTSTGTPAAEHHGLSKSRKTAAIVVPVLIGVAILIGIGACLLRRRRRNIVNSPPPSMINTRPVLHTAN